MIVALYPPQFSSNPTLKYRTSLLKERIDDSKAALQKYRTTAQDVFFVGEIVEFVWENRQKKNYGKMGKLMENQWTHWKPVENLWKIHWKLGMNKNIEKWSLPICILNWQVLFKWWDSGWRSGSYNVGPPHLCFCFCESLLQL